MLQKWTIRTALILILTASGAAAQAPLPPGHPAGIRKAELSDKQTIFMGVGALTLGLGVYFAAGHYKISGGSAAPPVTPPTTTATATTTTH